MLKGIVNKKSNILSVILIVFVTVLVYANCLINTFIWDDYAVIVENNFVKSRENIPALFNENYLSDYIKKGDWYFVDSSSGSGETSYRPVATLTYFLDYALWKLDPFGYHLTNLLLHVINALLIYSFIYLITKKKRIALLSSLLFALHPVNSEAVNVISFREDLLVLAFFLSSLILYIKLNKLFGLKKRVFYLLSLFSFFLALFSKEMAIILPFILILYDYFFVIKGGLKGISARLKYYSGYIIILLFYLFVRFFLIVNNNLPVTYPGESFYINILTMSRVVVTYLKWLFLPVGIYATIPDWSDLTVNYFFDFRVLFSIVLLLACFLIAIRIHKSSKYYSFAIFWFFITLLPVSNLFPITSYIASRFLYLPALGFCLFAGVLLNKGWVKKLRYLPLIILAIYSVLTFERNTYWENNTEFHLRMAQRYPNNSLIHLELGNCYYKTGLIDKAINEYKIALKLDSGLAWAYSNLGFAFARKQQYKEAITCFNQAIKIDPDDPKVYNSLAVTYAKIKKWQEAKKAWVKALEIDPEFEAAKKNLLELEEFKKAGLKAR
ncbi:MAG: tetratricopeptide repeat protein [Candidatus Omnitrophota bacterium]